jgi:hypothetical protein
VNKKLFENAQKFCILVLLKSAPDFVLVFGGFGTGKIGARFCVTDFFRNVFFMAGSVQFFEGCFPL